MNYGFVIDNRKCIGCHACSTACKSENEVPLGVNRTWVKYTESGIYPDARRHFQVTRCNHCANPPCVRICPVTAMYQRDDGIVEFDPDVCIGCKACMQACPYDAIYVDPDSGTVAKCHFCSHRVELDLEPACVVVCPEHAIIAGDMDDPSSEISHTLAKNNVTVRKPEQGTSPKLFYIDGNDISMHPTATSRTPETYMWADVVPLHGGDGHSGDGHANEPIISLPVVNKKSDSGQPIRTPQTQGLPDAGPIQVGGTMAEHMVQVSYNAQHNIPWHWPVPAYLVTKGIAAGIFMIMALGFIFEIFTMDPLTMVVSGLVSLIFVTATTGLLVYDLERPERFLRIIFRPQWKSWLVRGAFLLIGFSTLDGLWWAAEAGAYFDLISPDMADMLRGPVMWIGLPLAIGAAIYTAFLFGQAEGRDLWQSTLLPAHLIIQALMMGAASFMVIGGFMDLSAELTTFVNYMFGFTVALDLAVTLFGEFGMPHASEVAARAAHEISHGRYKNHFWYGSVVLGHVIPLALMFVGMPIAGVIAGVASAIGLYLFEYAFVMAPQEIPNS